MFEWVDRTDDDELVPVEVTLTQVELSGAERVLAHVRDISDALGAGTPVRGPGRGHGGPLTPPRGGQVTRRYPGHHPETG